MKFLIAILCAAALAACHGDSNSNDAATDHPLLLQGEASFTLNEFLAANADVTSRVGFAGQRWNLIAHGDRDELLQIFPSLDIYLSFSEPSDGKGRVGGYDGCNSFGAGYTLAGDGSLSLGLIFGTFKACPFMQGTQLSGDAPDAELEAERQRLRDQHRLFMGVLSDLQRYEVVGDLLVLESAQDSILVFSAS